MAFVRAAASLPEDRLRRIDREWDRLQPHRAVLVELFLGAPEELVNEARELREYVTAEARRAAAERPAERLIPEDIAEAILPAARALLLRRLLANATDKRGPQAFASLTAPFADILPSRK
jgi:hypothetical protein